ncbi:MAG: hypothetical protein JOZ72_13240 [Alphaproteobacteria bacterium]|nr:hypothetical protein [Alphaproteobacteria bacterium]
MKSKGPNGLAVCAALAMLVLPQEAVAEGAGETVRADGGVLSFVAQGGRGNRPVSAGYTAITRPRSLNCTSAAGCLLSAESLVTTSHTTNYSICTLVDGQPAKPVCPVDGLLAFPNYREHASLTPGRHTVQTFVFAKGADPQARLGIWEVDYTLYGR